MKYFEELKNALIKKGAKGAITKESNFKDMGIDSLDLMDMIVELEGKLNVTISDDKLMEIKKVSDLLNIIDELEKN